MSAERSHGRRGAERSAERSNGHSKAGTRSKPAREQPQGASGRKAGQVKRTKKQKATEPPARGQANALARGQGKSPSSKAPNSNMLPERGQPSPSPTKPATTADPARPTAQKATPPGQLKLPK